MIEDASRLNEVVIIGYGSTIVKDATGSVESVTEKDFTRGNIVTADNLLSGRVAGVNITTDGGAPGSGSTIRIRGGSSVNANNDPLIIIDGLPITNDNVGGSRGILSTLNPNDIESFSVLKDASATAIYGSRASNGVIIVTTKKGRSTFSADIDTQYSFGSIDDKVDVFSADEFRALVNSQPINGSTVLDTSLLGNANTDWQDEIFRETVSAVHNITLRGQLFNFLPTRFSFGVSRQEGALITSLNERRNLSLSLNPTFFDDHLKVNVNANLAFEDNRFADRGQIGQALRYDPTQPVFDANNPFFAGYYQHTVPGNQSLVANGGTNPVFNLKQRNNTGDVNRTFGNINLDYKLHFLPELRAVLNLGYDHSEASTATFARFATQDDINSEVSFSNQQRFNRSLDGYLNYVKDNDTFDYNVTVGYSYQVFTDDGGFTGNLNDPQAQGDTFAAPDVVLVGFFGRVNLDYNDKYLLTLNYRRDGTSRFSKENRWGNFGGAALAWRISDEDFLKDSNIISELKFRASIGWNGQQDLGTNSDLYLQRLRQGRDDSFYQFGNAPLPTLIPSEINPDIKWEETRTIEFGIDYGLFDNRLTGTLGVFQKDSEDLLFDAPVVDGSNFTNSILQNIGNLSIQGIEFSLNADVIRNDNLNWNLNFNATLLDREITELAFGADVPTGINPSGTGGALQIHRVGEAPSSFYVLKQLYDTSGNPIEGAYADLNGDNIINDEDRYVKENPGQNAIFGFQSNLNYKNFDFSFNLRASLGGYVYNNVTSANAQYTLLRDQNVLGNIPTAVLDTNFQLTPDVVFSDLYVENASFLRMDNITLGYTFKDISKFLKSLRVWAGVQNAFIISNYSGLDPEIGGGIDNNNFPRTRNILAGANFKF